MESSLLSKNEFIKASGAIQIANISQKPLSLRQMKIWNVLLANAWHQLKDKEEHDIHILDLMRFLGQDHRNYEALKEDFRQLAHVLCEWNIMRKDKEVEWGVAGLLSQAIVTNATTCKYAYPPRIRELLADHRVFARLSLITQQHLRSKYSLILYENCMDYRKLKRTPYYPLETFRQLMGIEPNEYQEFKRFSQRVIRTPVKEVNEKTPLRIVAEYKREKRKVVAIRFLIEEKEGFQVEKEQDHDQLPLFDNPIHKTINHELLNILTLDYKLSKEVAQRFLEEKSKEYIEQNLHKVDEYVATQRKKGKKIQNLGALTNKALSEDWYEPERKVSERTQIAHTARNEFRQREHHHQLLERLRTEYKAFLTFCIDEALAGLVPSEADPLLNEFEKTIPTESALKIFQEKRSEGKANCSIVRLDLLAFLRKKLPLFYYPPKFEEWILQEFGIRQTQDGENVVLQLPKVTSEVFDLFEKWDESLEWETDKVWLSLDEDEQSQLLEKYEKEIENKYYLMKFRTQKQNCVENAVLFNQLLARVFPEKIETPSKFEEFARFHGLSPKKQETETCMRNRLIISLEMSV